MFFQNKLPLDIRLLKHKKINFSSQIVGIGFHKEDFIFTKYVESCVILYIYKTVL